MALHKTNAQYLATYHIVIHNGYSWNMRFEKKYSTKTLKLNVSIERNPGASDPMFQIKSG